MSELALISAQLEAATCPEDIWPSEQNLKATFRMLAKLIHPDHNGNLPLSQDATARLNQLKNEADVRIAAGTFGKKLPLKEHEPIKIESYLVESKCIRGDVADVYTTVAQKLIIKVARSSDDNDLLRAERFALEKLKKGITTNVMEGIPKLMDTFQIGRREANVLERCAGWYTAEELHSFKLDPRHAVWIFKRLLTLLGWVHHLGLVHGAVLPPHTLFYPDNDEGTEWALPVVHSGSRGGGKTVSHHNDPRKHTIRLIDWCYSLEYAKRTRLSAWCPQWETHYPPELLAKKSIGPSADLYMAAKLIEYLFNPTLLGPLQDVLSKCLYENPALRYQKAADVFEDWRRAAKTVFGEPKWIDLEVKR